MSDPKGRYSRWIRDDISNAKYYIHIAKMNHINYDMYGQRAHLEMRQKYEIYAINKILNAIEYLKMLG